MNKADSKLKQRVWQALKNNMKFQRDERQIENEHNSRKAQIDNFFANLKKKVATEKTEESVEKEKHDLKERVRQRVN